MVESAVMPGQRGEQGGQRHHPAGLPGHAPVGLLGLVLHGDQDQVDRQRQRLRVQAVDQLDQLGDPGALGQTGVLQLVTSASLPGLATRRTSSPTVTIVVLPPTNMRPPPGKTASWAPYWARRC